MNTKGIMNAKAAVVLFSLILAACGGGSSDGGGESEPAEVAEEAVVAEEAEVEEAPSYETHSTNLTGVWLGVDSFCFLGFICNDLELTVIQAVSDSAEGPVQALTGKAFINGSSTEFTGTKEGDVWSVKFELSADLYVRVKQTLSSANESSGFYTVINRVTGVETADAGTASFIR